MTENSPFLDGAIRWVYDGDIPVACPACGYRWDTAWVDALDMIEFAPDEIRRILDGRDGMQAQADGSWTASAYIWHLTDLATIWSERWIQISHSPDEPLVGFDPDILADARGYRDLPTSAGLWALGRAVSTFVTTTRSVPPDSTFEHGDWGRGTVGDAVRWLGHEFHHHTGDIDERASEF
jgi:hypothetical protein